MERESVLQWVIFLNHLRKRDESKERRDESKERREGEDEKLIYFLKVYFLNHVRL
jgi:hypothetical protein